MGKAELKFGQSKYFALEKSYFIQIFTIKLRCAANQGLLYIDEISLDFVLHWGATNQDVLLFVTLQYNNLECKKPS